MNFSLPFELVECITEYLINIGLKQSRSYKFQGDLLTFRISHNGSIYGRFVNRYFAFHHLEDCKFVFTLHHTRINEFLSESDLKANNYNIGKHEINFYDSDSFDKIIQLLIKSEENSMSEFYIPRET